MDFSWIEQHPWATTAIVGIGGIGVYLLLRGSSSGGSGGGEGGGVIYASGGGGDPAAAAAQNIAQIQANAQVSQYSAELAALTIQTDAQIRAAQIGAEVTNRQTDAALTSDLYRTGAELTYGLSSQETVLEMARINAGVQQRYIDSISSGPLATQQTPIRAAVPTPETIYTESQTLRMQVQTPAGVGPIIPGGQPLLPWPDFETCSTWDRSCTDRNLGRTEQHIYDLRLAQAGNNYNQCVANAGNTKTPEEYAAVMARCDAQRSEQS